jgi:hypothetical protein
MNRSRRALLLGIASTATISGCSLLDRSNSNEGETDPEPEMDSSPEPPTSGPTEQTDQQNEEEDEGMSEPAIFTWDIEGSTVPDWEARINSGPINEEGPPTYEREFRYEYRGESYENTQNLPEGIVEYYEGIPRHDDEFGRYVSDPFDDLVLSPLALSFSERGGNSTLEKVNHCMRFVQSLEYTTDEISAGISQYSAYPVETIESSEGDCEDTSILLGAFLELLEIDSVLLLFPDAQHMALGIRGSEDIPEKSFSYQGKSYYYAETTAPGWRVAEIPEDIQGHQPEFVDFNSHPIVNASWNALPTVEASLGEFGVDLSVGNAGQATANGVTVEVDVELRDGTIVDSTTVDFGRVEVEQVLTSREFLEAVKDELRLSVRIYLEGRLHNDGVSRWVAPEE